MSHSQKTILARVLIFLSAAITTLCLTSAPLAANEKTIVLLDPLSIGMKKGETRTMALRVQDASELYGIEFHLRFDPKIVQVQDDDAAKKGAQIKTGDWFADGFVATNKVDNAKGTIDYAVTLLNPTPALNGDGVIATIQFKAVRDGASPLKVSKAILATRDAQEIESEWQDGAIGVSASGQAPNVQKTNQNSNSSPSNNTTPQIAAPSVNLLLVGAAGIGVLAFVSALVIVLGIMVWRGRSRAGSRR